MRWRCDGTLLSLSRCVCPAGKGQFALFFFLREEEELITRHFEHCFLLSLPLKFVASSCVCVWKREGYRCGCVSPLLPG
ncbi:hypothetical protein TRSC58_07208 [Trypanosoma rangeli SC58]|uniref:Uncharacterized protein n=1 Tax=Trypanosoma rangeli SC58 TaxID=429131 RepID=A0A061IS66_TRYRA|nr:hypothetical protein TRSC58_07208 [Trypanosoma rangeli SC58]